MNPDNNDENENSVRSISSGNGNSPNSRPLPSTHRIRMHFPVPVTQYPIASTSGMSQPRLRVRFQGAFENSPSTSNTSAMRIPEPDSSVSPTPLVHREAPLPNYPDVSFDEMERLIRPGPVPSTFINCAEEIIQWFRGTGSYERLVSPIVSNRSTTNSSDTVSVPSPFSDNDTQEPENLLTHSEMMDQEHRLIFKWEKIVYGAKLKYYRKKRRALSKKASPNQEDMNSETDSDLESVSSSD